MYNKSYFVYILECKDSSLYTGISTNPERRLKEHQSSKYGAKYTKAHKPVRIVFIEEYANRSEASKREYAIKQLTRAEKLDLIKKLNKTPQA